MTESQTLEDLQAELTEKVKQRVHEDIQDFIVGHRVNVELSNGDRAEIVLNSYNSTITDVTFDADFLAQLQTPPPRRRWWQR